MNSHDKSAKFYDCIYARRFGEGLNQLTQANLRQIQQLIPSGKILDFGAGTGRLSIPLAKLGYEVEAIDISQAMLDVLIEKAARENLIIQTAQEIENTDWSKDMVISVLTVFAYIQKDLEMESTIKFIYDSLKPGGYFMFDLVKKEGYQQFCRTNNCIVREVSGDNYFDFVKVELFNKDENLFAHYHEKVSIVCNNENMQNEKFDGEENFDIRFWEIKQIENIMKWDGFIKINQFDLGGSDYFIYQKPIS